MLLAQWKVHAMLPDAPENVEVLGRRFDFITKKVFYNFEQEVSE